MGTATGQDFSDVKVHTDPESHALNDQLGAKAFTTGSDIFFRSGAYDPGSSGGRELLTHELTHVVQQRSGSVNSGGSSGRMTVNAPGDAYEQEADSVAKSVTSAAPAANVQKKDELTTLQRAAAEEEEEEPAAAEEPEEEEVQMQELEEDEEVV